MTAIYQPKPKQTSYPVDKLAARRVLLIQQMFEPKSNEPSGHLNSIADFDRLQTVSTKLEALSQEQKFASFVLSHQIDGVLNQVNKAQANMLVLLVDQLTPTLIEQLSNINQLIPLTVIVFARKHSPENSPKLIAAGVDSYKVGCSGPAFDTADLAVILDVAEYHFAHLSSVQTQLVQTQQKLAERKIIERAKGILMQQHGLSEEMAYAQMRRSAMNQGRSIASLASCLIDIVESAN